MAFFNANMPFPMKIWLFISIKETLFMAFWIIRGGWGSTIIWNFPPFPTQRQPNLNVVGGWTWKWLYTPTTHTNSMLAISQLLLTQFWQNFKVRSLWPSWTLFQLSQWHLSSQQLPWRLLSQLLLTQFWQNLLDPIFCTPWIKIWFQRQFCLTETFWT